MPTNYFEIYHLPVSIVINIDEVKNKYYELSKKYHPDFYINDTEDKQLEALTLSTQNTEAYNTLIDENKRIKHILSLYNLYDESNTEKLPQEFLMEMMDLNEQLMELEFDFDENVITTIKKELDENQAELVKLITPFAEDLSLLNDDEREIELNKLKDYYLKRKYLLRIQERLDKFAAR